MKIFGILLLLTASALTFAEVSNEESLSQTPKIETSYDSGRNKTTVRMAPMKIADEKGVYHSIHLAPAYSYQGREPRTPEIIDFEVQTVVKARRLKVDLYVLFLIDGEKSFLSSDRRAVKNPVPGRRWVGERLVFRMPLDTLFKLANAKQAVIRMDGLDFELTSDHLSSLREFAETASEQKPGMSFWKGCREGRGIFTPHAPRT